MLKEFRQFVLRGNMLDLAVAVVIGVAFTAVKKCPECLSEIPLEARRCAFCTSQLG
jgi:hypothetical protein